ncbi:cytochrome c family protein [Megalodesulfovibrio paquesii]
MRVIVGLWAPALLLALVFCCAAARSGAEEGPRYIGSKACADCHAEQYDRFMEHSKKARSWKSVELMRPKLKPAELQGCYDCHTTGHGKPGGFVSYEQTPQLADVGCETCHGPGSAHAETGDTSLITRTPAIESCKTCHNESRVRDFHFKPLRFSGAH